MQKTISHYVRILSSISDRINNTNSTDNAEHQADQWIDNQFVADQLKSLWRQTGDELLGLSPDKMPMGTWSLICEFMLSAPTLGELYRKGSHIVSFLKPNSLNLNCKTTGDEFSVSIQCYQGDLDPHRFLSEFICVTYHRFPCWASNHYVPLKKAWFSYPAPPHAWFYEEMFQCPILFDQDTTGFSFDKKHLSLAVCRNQTELDEWLKESPADLLYLPGRDTTVSNHVRKQLFLTLRDERRLPSFKRICESLNLSSQVVRRRLAEEDNNYQQLKDSVRSDLVCELLANSELSLSEISERAGFAESASFSKAFKKWTAMSPADFRKTKKGQIYQGANI